VGAGYVNYAHAEQIKAAKAEAALAAKIESEVRELGVLFTGSVFRFCEFGLHEQSRIIAIDLIAPKTARSLLWLAAIKSLERVKNPPGLSPQGSFIAAETIQREIGQVGQTQKTASELDIGNVGVFPSVGYRFHLTYSTVRNRMHAPPE
jgi:hypothetical protein